MNSTDGSKVAQSLVCLALASLYSPGASGNSAGAPLAPITIYTDFQPAPRPLVVEAMQAEVSAIMAPAGLRLEWRPLADFRSETVSAAVVVAHFESRCDTGGLAMRENQPGSLGWTDIGDGRFLPFVHVDCARVRTFLQIGLLGYRPQDRESIYGRALGRVLAHELYHVLVVTDKHATRGVGKAEYSVTDLLAADFHLHEKEIEALRGSQALAGLRAAKAHP